MRSVFIKQFPWRLPVQPLASVVSPRKTIAGHLLMIILLAGH
jgi:hypothetical protein